MRGRKEERERGGSTKHDKGDGEKRARTIGGKKLSGFANPCEKHAWNRAAGGDRKTR